jgi:hypothetical protein
MYTQLKNGDQIELLVEEGRVVANKRDKTGERVITKLNVSRDTESAYNPFCLVLSNSGFYVFWINGGTDGDKIYGRRYTAQGLAGKIFNFKINHLVKSGAVLNVELKDDFFLVINWVSHEDKMYTKTFNQDSGEIEDEEYVKDVPPEPEPETENITLTIDETPSSSAVEPAAVEPAAVEPAAVESSVVELPVETPEVVLEPFDPNKHIRVIEPVVEQQPDNNMHQMGFGRRKKRRGGMRMSFN